MVRVLLKLFEKGGKEKYRKKNEGLLIKLYNLKYRAHDKNRNFATRCVIYVKNKQLSFFLFP